MDEVQLRHIAALLANHEVLLKQICELLAVQDLAQMKKLPQLFSDLKERH